MEILHESQRRRARRPSLYPEFDFVGAPAWVSSAPRDYVKPRRPVAEDYERGKVPIECEMLQVCDVLLGAAHLAVQPDNLFRVTDAKVLLARRIRDVIADEFLWVRTAQTKLYRRYVVSLYPDKYGRAYPASKAQYNSISENQPPLPGVWRDLFEERMDTVRPH